MDEAILNSTSFMPLEQIVCSAIWFDVDEQHEHQPINRERGLTICGLRHHNCFYTASLIGKHLRNKEPEQGFVTNEHRFVSREEAALIAFQAGQVGERKEKLYSEDLWKGTRPTLRMRS